MNQSEQLDAPVKKQTSGRTRWLWTLLLILVLAAAAYFRFTGIFWGDYQYLHPDERFLVWVTADLKPVASLSQYFNTAESTLNPNNVGHGFYVYGTFPVIATHYLAQAIFGQAGWRESLQVGRVFSAGMDLITILLVYLIGARIFNRKIGVLGAAFSALAVTQIQQAHFYTTDSYSTTFSTLALYIAVLLATLPIDANGSSGSRWGWLKSPTLRLSAWFGFAVGLAMACKVNTAPVAVLLPAAWLIYWYRLKRDSSAVSIGIVLRDLIIGGAITFLAFRILQPYAFSGPGFFGILPNPQWIQNLKDLAAQTSGDVDFPPALQWARRPVTFSWQNMVAWGFGLPLGLLAWAGFIWMGWRIFKGEWQKSSLLWGWTGAYFIWQSLQGNPTMRYQLPIYPTLAVIGAWAVYRLWQEGAALRERLRLGMGRFLQVLSVFITVMVLVATAGWAFAFTRIYTRPVTRVAASSWIYDNVPGPVTLHYQTASGEYQQPLPYDPVQTLASGQMMRLGLIPRHSGVLNQIYFSTINDLTLSQNTKTLTLTVRDPASPNSSVGYGMLVDSFTADNREGLRRAVTLDPAPFVEAGKTYTIELAVNEPSVNLSFAGAWAAGILTADEEIREVQAPLRNAVRENQYQEINFEARQTGQISEVELYRLLDQSGNYGNDSIRAALFENPVSTDPIATGTDSGTFTPQSGDPRGSSAVMQLSPAVTLQQGRSYTLRFYLASGQGELAIYGAAPANESSWDDGLPVRMGGYDPYGGIYEGDLNFEMYWDDNQDKLDRFEETLDRADYVFISSNRQWGTTTRLPERYPLTTTYYRALLGCPDEQDILWCYSVAKPGMFNGKLGFDLIQVFDSYPNIGTYQINDQLAEEAFTVYDHPKVLIFKKNTEYNPDNVRQLLGAVDLTTVVHVIPGKAPSYPADLLLPEDALATQEAGGTWSAIFNTTALQNRYPGIGLVLWYLVILLLGWMIYPLLRITMKGLNDRGYPMAKIAALLLLSWLVWVAGSAGVSFSRFNITWIAFLLLIGCAALAYWQRGELREELRSRWRYYLLVEGIGLAFFLIFVGIRLGNPDLWHPNFGGEKPMDFAYFNAVIKSTTFPPYDPWYAEAYINYYYYGFVLAAVPVKWLGIVPSIAYNLILPSFFSMLALGAFSAGWNILKALKPVPPDESNGKRRFIEKAALIGGLAAAVAVLGIGNLGTVRMLWQGFMKLAAPNGNFQDANLFQQLAWMVQGIGQAFRGAHLPYGTGDWYWIPSRAIPDGVITEFPFFTFLYADPHAHLFALPLTLLALGWGLSMVFNRWDWQAGRKITRWLSFGLTFVFGGIVIGSLRPVNTWDLPTYLGLAVVATIYSAVRYAPVPEGFLASWKNWARRLVIGLAASVILAVLSFAAYMPYSHWYAAGYNSFVLWNGPFSPFWSYLTHWGIFLFVIVTWLFWETRDWMAATPLSSLNKLKPYRGWIYAAAVLFALVIVGLTIRKITVGWLALSIAVWAAVMLFRTKQPDGKRVLEFMIGSAAFLTLGVEIVTLKGDVGRMNTVFKFYLQAWTLFAVSSGVCLVLLFKPVFTLWKASWRRFWLGAVIILVASGLLFPLTAAPAKIKDRISKTAPHTLDGMLYMQSSVYYDQNDTKLTLNEDYEAIRWMQENVQGSPVIVEGIAPEYRWGARYSIYTGLPAVLGWNWHQRQQRAVLPDTLVWARVSEVEEFYNTLDQDVAKGFLERYNISYIIVGQMEGAYYTPEGLAKFTAWDGTLWNSVFKEGSTTIYQVVR